jgi:8-oxo-dGTP pyrophosphatase MutT (NUDIX family)
MVQAWLRASSVIPLNVHLHQVLVLRRGPTAKFMPNSYVFPGGKLDELDAQFPRIMTNFDKGEDNQPIRLGLDSDFPLRVCAIREMFEESGLLPVVDGNCREKTILTVNEDLHLAEWRKKVCTLGDLEKIFG